MKPANLKPTREEQLAAQKVAKEAVSVVFDLGARLPPEVLSSIYSEVVGKLGLRAGLKPKIVSRTQSEDSAL